jgi:ribosomal protein S18 acetylase RimI-like enzyme
MKYIPLKYIKEDPAVGNADSSEDAKESTGMLERLVAGLREQLAELSPQAETLRRADLLLQLGRALVRLEKRTEAWAAAREAFDLYLAEQAWEGAAQACDILFLADQPQSLAALGQGIWLAVTYPVDPELSVALLQHVVDETPPDADGAAVAAVMAYYLADLRAREPQREHLLIYANQVLATVARRHSGVEGQQDFNQWIEDMELNDPARFLPRLRNIVDVLVQDDWWFDREALQAALPVD